MPPIPVEIYEWTTGKSMYENLPDWVVPPPDGEIFIASRPLTGFYAGTVAMIGLCQCHVNTRDNCIYPFVFVGFMLITSTIQLFNDFIDRNHDIKKGKTLAHLKPWHVLGASIKLGIYALLMIWVLYSATNDWLLPLHLLLVLGAGLAYSYLRRILVVQNAVVALCAASPILCGAIFTHTLPTEVMWIFTLLALFVFAREVVKDLIDSAIDSGWKRTIPLKYGHTIARVVVGCIVGIIIVLIATYPVNLLVKTTAIGFALPLLAIRRNPRQLKVALDLPGYVFLSILAAAS